MTGWHIVGRATAAVPSVSVRPDFDVQVTTGPSDPP
jgi:hypothetical protein